jgi:hypothetical protein
MSFFNLVFKKQYFINPQQKVLYRNCDTLKYLGKRGFCEQAAAKRPVQCTKGNGTL